MTNQDPAEHTWSADSGSAKQWDSGTLEPSASFSVTFAAPGEFGFHCNIHPSMVGTIVVVAAPPTTPPAPATTTTTVAGATPPTSVFVAPAATAPTALPRTGSSGTVTLVAVASVSTLLGAALLASGNRRRRHPTR